MLNSRVSNLPVALLRGTVIDGISVLRSCVEFELTWKQAQPSATARRYARRRAVIPVNWWDRLGQAEIHQSGRVCMLYFHLPTTQTSIVGVPSPANSLQGIPRYPAPSSLRPGEHLSESQRRCVRNARVRRG